MYVAYGWHKVSHWGFFFFFVPPIQFYWFIYFAPVSLEVSSWIQCPQPPFIFGSRQPLELANNHTHNGDLTAVAQWSQILFSCCTMLSTFIAFLIVMSRLIPFFHSSKPQFNSSAFLQIQACDQTRVLILESLNLILQLSSRFKPAVRSSFHV
jgi:hypothetical protein